MIYGFLLCLLPPLVPAAIGVFVSRRFGSRLLGVAAVIVCAILMERFVLPYTRGEPEYEVAPPGYYDSIYSK